MVSFAKRNFLLMPVINLKIPLKIKINAGQIIFKSLQDQKTSQDKNEISQYFKVNTSDPHTYSDAFYNIMVDPSLLSNIPTVVRHDSIFEKFWIATSKHKSEIYFQGKTDNDIPFDIIEGNNGHAITDRGEVLLDDNGNPFVPLNDNSEITSVSEVIPEWTGDGIGFESGGENSSFTPIDS
jgi:hypothetical protein